MTLVTASRSRTHACKPAQVTWLGRLEQAIAIWRQRRALSRLDARALEDIGLSRAQAECEARRPIWDAPETWRR